MVISEQTDDAQGFAFDSHIPIVVGGCGQEVVEVEIVLAQ